MADIEETIAQESDSLQELMLADARAEIARLRGQRDRILIRMGPNGRFPVRQHHGDAGWDLYCAEPTWVPAHGFADIPSHNYVQMPPNIWAIIVGRSSTLRKRGLLVPQGIIDQGWRGELFSGCWNLTDRNVLVNQGERIAQFIPMPLVAATCVLSLVSELDAGDRGTNGFGSTGV